MRSIGEMARDSGLSVSALRFYDGAGVLAPAWTDPRTGYRWYDDRQVPDARLVARLRRVGMPLPDIRRVLEERDGRLLDTHLRRLEDGLADARRELSRVRALLGPEEKTMTTRLTVPAAELASALDAVRFAASADPEQPALCGVLFDVDGDELTLVATDRYRLAVSRVKARVKARAEANASVIADSALADGIRELARDADEVELAFDGRDITASTAAGGRVTGERLDHDFPDYRQLLRLEPTHRVTVRTAELREKLAGGPEVSMLDLVPDLRVAVNRQFLLDALMAADREQLVLELGGPVAPLAIRLPDREDTMSLLMPIRLQ